MNTSYFAKSGNHPNAVSIAGKAPSWYTGRQYKKLAPSYRIFKRYKEDGDQVSYTEHFYKEVLNKLDPEKVLRELGSHAVILCYETPEKFCHRQLVAQWFQDKLNIIVSEIQ
jgi:uncharacterized protein (DUF488 family)